MLESYLMNTEGLVFRHYKRTRCVLKKDGKKMQAGRSTF